MLSAKGGIRYTISIMAVNLPIRSSQILAVAVAAVVIGAIALVGFSAVYAGKIYPGVSVDGMYLGGLDKAAAEREIQTQATQYNSQQILVTYGGTSLTVPVSGLGVKYSTAGVVAAIQYGRQGSLAEQLRARVRSLFGRPTVLADYSYSDAALAPVIAKIGDAVTQPVANAALSFSGGQVAVVPSQPGYRLDRGLLTEAIDNQLAGMNDQAVTANVYAVAPTIDEATLTAAKHQADAYVVAPITAQANGAAKLIDQPTILSWVDITATTAGSRSELGLDPLQSFYPPTEGPTVSLTLNHTKVAAYVAQMADALNRAPRNAVLSMQNGTLTVVQASQTGLSVDLSTATGQLMKVLDGSAAARTITLPTTVTQAAVNENNLASLGITDQISSGNTTFPGSSANRITNVTVGARQFNDVLLSPGQVFSFGQILGPVGPEQGYKPGLVILGNHEENQYGGGLCQVATTAFRAALLAGLPINQRSNHSYAVSFYTSPYGVPGVDATIFYPQVDLKFTNDTGHYILIQTSISGSSLTFNYYGTKTKTGVIVPPHFVYGTTDATKPSQTVFQRQIQDLSGNVVKTDTFTQSYASSTDFPIEQTSNGA